MAAVVLLPVHIFVNATGALQSLKTGTQRRGRRHCGLVVRHDDTVPQLL